ncbi:MAG TPA: type I-U CRISPR-associated protein Csb2 [Spirochaetia bacterium]|nr:type I-U CRISPR-associated protein Csb2 [Spirochaetia bacterium]
MLVVEIEYLNGRVYATDTGRFNEDGKPEWPPHPARLFAALVATCYEGGLDADERDAGLSALRWLERQPPPHIRALPPVLDGTDWMRVHASVPSNGPKSLNRSAYSKLKDGGAVWFPPNLRWFPCFTPEDPRVYFMWPQSDPDGTTRSALALLAQRLIRLGSSMSLVKGDLVNDAPPPTLEPSQTGSLRLRVYTPGSLATLDRQFASGERWPLQVTQCYQTVGASPETHSPRVPVDPMTIARSVVIFRKVDGPEVPAEATIHVGGAFRDTLMSILGEGAAPAALHGHGGKPHCLVAAVPSVGHQHSDGHLLGVMVILPQEVASEERTEVQRALLDLPNRAIRVPGGTWRLLRVLPGERRAGSLLDPLAWAGPARRWASVSPVLLGRHPAKKMGRNVYDDLTEELREVLKQTCTLAGLPTPCSIRLSPTPFVPGSPPAGRFVRGRMSVPTEAKYASRFGVHVLFDFEEPILGPLLVGAYRHFGMGLLRPVDSGRWG